MFGDSVKRLSKFSLRHNKEHEPLNNSGLNDLKIIKDTRTVFLAHLSSMKAWDYWFLEVLAYSPYYCRIRTTLIWYSKDTNKNQVG